MIMYQPLPHHDAIRLLAIVGCTPELPSRLTLELSIHRLEDVSRHSLSPDMHGYDALSYTWGAPVSGLEFERKYAPDQNVLVTVRSASKGYETRIGRNLYEALTQIWSSGRRRLYWVDALCINQADLAEREAQVAMMGDIYSYANQVLVWFGPEDPQDPGFELLAWIHMEFLDQLYAWTSTNEREGDMDFIRESLIIDPEDQSVSLPAADISMSSEAARALCKFYATRRYLHRAWIVQEIALAQEPIAILGKYLVHVHNIELVAISLANLLFRENFAPDGPKDNSGDGMELRAIRSLGEFVEGHRDGRTETYRRYGAFDHTSRYWSAWYMALHTGHQPRAYDPRDVIYSLHGIVHTISSPEKVPNPLKPDYRQPVAELYRDLTVRMLRGMPQRTVLSQVGEREPSDFASSLPSWVPDYSSCRRFGLGIEKSIEQITGTYPTFSAAGPSDSAHSTLEVVGNELLLFARRAGCVTAAHEFQHPELGAHGEDAARLVDLRQSYDIAIWVLELCSKAQYDRHPTGETVAQVLFRILSYDARLEQDDDDDDSVSPAKSMNDFLTGLLLSAQGADEKYLPKEMVNNLKSTLQLLEGEPGIPTREYLERRIDQLASTMSVSGSEMEAMSREERNVHTSLLQELLSIQQNQLKIYSPWTSTIQLFETDTGHWGRMANNVQIGDELWLLRQANCPFVLRPVIGAGSNTYLLLAEAFVPGAMYGELVWSGVAGETRRITLG